MRITNKAKIEAIEHIFVYADKQKRKLSNRAKRLGFPLDSHQIKDYSDAVDVATLGAIRNVIIRSDKKE